MSQRSRNGAAPRAGVLLLGLVTGWAVGRRDRPVDRGPGTAWPLIAAQYRIQELEATLVALRDEKDAAFGRLETGAIQAMESTIARSAERIADLESQVADVSSELHACQNEILTQRRRHEQLQSALQQRDQRIAELRSRNELER